MDYDCKQLSVSDLQDNLPVIGPKFGEIAAELEPKHLR
jgi:hypothetical protein